MDSGVEEWGSDFWGELCRCQYSQGRSFEEDVL